MKCPGRVIANLLIIAGAVTSPPLHAQTSDDVVIRGEDRYSSVACPPSHVASRLAGLFAAITRGDPNVVDEYFGRGTDARFIWFSVGGPAGSEDSGITGYSWDEVEDQLPERYAQNEHLELKGIQFTRVNPAGINFGPVEVVRRADDLPLMTAYWLTGKGVYDCSTQAFVVLGLGSAKPESEFRSYFGLVGEGGRR